MLSTEHCPLPPEGWSVIGSFHGGESKEALQHTILLRPSLSVAAISTARKSSHPPSFIDRKATWPHLLQVTSGHVTGAGQQHEQKEHVLPVSILPCSLYPSAVTTSNFQAVAALSAQIPH